MRKLRSHVTVCSEDALPHESEMSAETSKTPMPKSKLVPIALKVTDRRVDRHEQRRLRYLDEAMNIIVESGIEQLTIANLAVRMQGSKGAVYRYFPSKDALLIGLQERAMEDLRTFIMKRLDRLDALLEKETSEQVKVIAKLSMLMTCYIEHGEVSPREHRLIDDYVGAASPIMAELEARQISQEMAMRVLSIVQDNFNQAVEVKALASGPSGERTLLMWAFVHGLDHFRKRTAVTPEHLQVPSLIKAARQTFLKGMGAQDEILVQSEAILAQMPTKKG